MSTDVAEFLIAFAAILAVVALVGAFARPDAWEVIGRVRRAHERAGTAVMILGAILLCAGATQVATELLLRERLPDELGQWTTALLPGVMAALAGAILVSWGRWIQYGRAIDSIIAWIGAVVAIIWGALTTILLLCTLLGAGLEPARPPLSDDLNWVPIFLGIADFAIFAGGVGAAIFLARASSW